MASRHTATAPLKGSPYWRRHAAPEGCDLLLPPSMAGNYLLYFPRNNQRGASMTWGYRDVWDGGYGGVSYPQYTPPAASAVTTRRVSSHSPPTLVTSRPLPPSSLPLRTLHPQTTTTTTTTTGAKWTTLGPQIVQQPPDTYRDYRTTAATTTVSVQNRSSDSCLTAAAAARVGTEPPDATWTVFHCDDPQDAHTAILLKDSNKMLQCRPSSAVHISKMTFAEWEKCEAHRGAVPLGAVDSTSPQQRQLAKTRIIYTPTQPSTHIYADGHCIHLDAPVRVTFTTQTSPNRISFAIDNCATPRPHSRTVASGGRSISSWDAGEDALLSKPRSSASLSEEHHGKTSSFGASGFGDDLSTLSSTRDS